MKGAAGDVWAKIIKIPSKISITTIGIIHHIRSFQKKAKSSLTIEYLWRRFSNMLE